MQKVLARCWEADEPQNVWMRVYLHRDRVGVCGKGCGSDFSKMDVEPESYGESAHEGGAERENADFLMS